MRLTYLRLLEAGRNLQLQLLNIESLECEYCHSENEEVKQPGAEAALLMGAMMMLKIPVLSPLLMHIGFSGW